MSESIEPIEQSAPEPGPRLTLVDPSGARVAGDPLRTAAAALSAGRIVALKGVGGFLLCADARNQETVARLRQRKRRPHQPLALMARDLDEVEQVAHPGPAARHALLSAARPIVLMPARADSGVAPSVAPGLRELGLFLPPTPLLHLIAVLGPPLLVMTSGNRSGEPSARDLQEALARLGAVADLFLTHDRPIHTRVDDSLVRIVAGDAQLVRRARGYVPDPLPLPVASEPLLAVGGQLQSTVCVTRGSEALLSQHLGDLSCSPAFAWFEETVVKLTRLAGVTPARVAHDLHPDYRSTRWALERRLPHLGVQHHHAHVAACLAEHGRLSPTIGIAFDGTGCGPDGHAWGGEILIADLGRFHRLGHLRPLLLPGGEAAIREPWRLGLAALIDAGLVPSRLDHIDARRRGAVQHLISSGIIMARATGAGRWLDAVAALLGVRDEISYDAQAAAELEALATVDGAEPLPFAIESPHDAPFVIDLRPTVRALSAALDAGEPAALLASRFHETLARIIVASAGRARAEFQLDTVALSGGCFGNARLSERAAQLLAEDGFEVLHHRRVPPNDGGLAYGQAAIAPFHSWRDAPPASRHSVF